MSGMKEELAAEIRRIDGNHDMGASALAEALEPWIAARLRGEAQREDDAAPAPVAGEAVAYWLAVDPNGTVTYGLTTDDANGGAVSRQQVNDYINETDVAQRIVGVAALAQNRASQGAEVDALRTELAALKGDTSGFSGANSDDLHVDHFAAAMKGKLTLARSKGRSGWEDREDCPQQRLSDMLRAHVEKGDPIDVANFAMFLHQRGESILPGLAERECPHRTAAIALRAASGDSQAEVAE